MLRQSDLDPDVLDEMEVEAPRPTKRPCRCRYLTAPLKGERYCIRTGCRNRRVWHGLCASCAAYEFMRVIEGRVTWERLAAVSRALPDAAPPPLAVIDLCPTSRCLVPGCLQVHGQHGFCARHRAEARRLVKECVHPDLPHAFWALMNNRGATP